jgi:hypothetical protein
MRIESSETCESLSSLEPGPRRIVDGADPALVPRIFSDDGEWCNRRNVDKYVKKLKKTGRLSVAADTFSKVCAADTNFLTKG